MAQITLKGISKRFTVYERDSGRKNPFARRRRVVEALKEMSFSIERGELVGYIGPNGAGKSTSVKIMGGILTPDEGECRILNLTPWREREKHVQHIGVVFGQRSQLWWDVAVMDSMELLRDIYGLSQADFKTRLDELSERLALGNCSGPRRASCPWASACGARWGRRCCTGPKSCSWTSPPLGWTRFPSCSFGNF